MMGKHTSAIICINSHTVEHHSLFRPEIPRPRTPPHPGACSTVVPPGSGHSCAQPLCRYREHPRIWRHEVQTLGVAGVGDRSDLRAGRRMDSDPRADVPSRRSAPGQPGDHTAGTTRKPAKQAQLTTSSPSYAQRKFASVVLYYVLLTNSAC